MMKLTGEGKACILAGLTKTKDSLINWIKCVWKVVESIDLISCVSTSISTFTDSIHMAIICDCVVRVTATI